MADKKKTPDYQIRAQAKYDAAHTRKINLELLDTTDMDILDKLAAVGNKQGYIKGLIRKDIQNNG